MNKLTMQNCPTLNVVHIMGKRWSLPIIQEIYKNKEGVMFNELTRSMSPITPRNLSISLKELDKYGFVLKTQIMSRGIKYSKYNITKRGEKFVSIIKELKGLGIYWYGLDKACIDTNCIQCALISQ